MSQDETTTQNSTSLSRRAFLQAAAVGGTSAALLGYTGQNSAAARAAYALPQARPSLQDFPPDFDPMILINELEQGMPFAGIPSFMKMPHTRDFSAIQSGDLVVLGVPFDSGALVRSGTRHGPRALREQSTYAGVVQPMYPWTDDLTQIARIIDFGDVVPFPGTGAVDLMLEMTEFVCAQLYDAGARLLLLGGDHTLPYGPVRAAAAKYGPLALIHIDAHQDSFSSEELGGVINHTTFATDLVLEGHIDATKSSQVYIRTVYPPTPGDGYNIIYAEQAAELGSVAMAEQVKARIGDTPVYITIDIDALDAAYAPGTGAPVPGGPTSGELRAFLKALDGLNVVGADVTEVSPQLDPTEMTAIVGAMLGIDMLYLMAHAEQNS